MLSRSVLMNSTKKKICWNFKPSSCHIRGTLIFADAVGFELNSSIRKLATFQRAAPKEEKAVLFHYVYDGKHEVLNVTSKRVPNTFMRRLS